MQEKPILLISECELVTKINVGRHVSSVTTDIALLRIGEKKKKELCILSFVVSGVSLQITIQIAASVWWIQQSKQRKRMHLPSIASVSHNTTDLPVAQPPSRHQSCPAEASSEDSQKEGASSSAFVMRRLRQLGNKRCPLYSN